MLKRPAERDESLSHVRENRPFSVTFKGGDPPFWAIICRDANGNVHENSNLPDRVFTETTIQMFRSASELAARRCPQYLVSNTSALHFSPSDMCEESLAGDALDDKIELKIGGTEKVTAYYESAFKRLQQLNCRMLAKAFIKLIEPRKQVRHPYNGGRGSVPWERGDPELTKPDWWPRDVIHKEPDHLRQELRVKLLVHIIQQLLPMGVTADKLEEVANDNRRQIKPPAKVGILDELFRVRRLEERFEQQKVEATTVIYITNLERDKAGSGDEPDDNAENLETSPDTLNVQGSYDGSPMDTLQLPSGLHYAIQDGKMQVESLQPYIKHEGLATDTTPTMMNQSMHYNTFHFQTSSDDVKSINQPTQWCMNGQSFLSGWPHAINQNMFAPVHDYSGVNHPQIVDPTHNAYVTPPAHEVPSAHNLPQRTAPNPTW
ncbi:hypothetical protein PISL3812_09964 [Talaromyces islandicus]|uniref:Subtelomeric hrmA-associated cluster protein AFUB-079030/YDR124W-like helical bundle domain-containing protein n=1 Tax=Talaromyces islandicus TaxID=28573 RepID=A0A0U1MBH8_TALIS|nr:hypothetical protein PISL3812_09964 [Talaromyces islandicus]